MGLQRLVLELRPSARARLRHSRLGNSSAEPLEGGDPRFSGVAPLRLAAVTDSRRLSQETNREPGKSRLGSGSLSQNRPHERDVLDAPRHRSNRVERGHEGEDAVGGDESPLRLQPDDLTSSRGQADRATRVRAERELAETRGERGRRARRRAAGRLPLMCRVVARAVPLALTENTPGELRKVRLADEDGARVEETLDRRRSARGDVIGVKARAVRRSHAGRVEEVLDRERPPRERPRA